MFSIIGKLNNREIANQLFKICCLILNKPQAHALCGGSHENSQKDRSVVPRFSGKQLFTKTKSKEIAARANNYLLMLILNVKERP